MDNSQRFTQPSTTPPSLLPTSVRPRKRSRMSSDDSCSGNSQGQVKRSRDSCLKSGGRASTCKTRLAPKNVNASQKQSTNRKGSKHKFGSLQNAVVLAPFYTLKKAFQNKLMNFYSLQKLKKMNLKTNAGKKQNTRFEYDIIELKPKTLNIKKEGKTNRKLRRKSKTVNDSPSKKNKKKTFKNKRNMKRKMSNKVSLRTELKNFLKGSETKRKNPNVEVVAQTALKSECGPMPNFLLPNCQSYTPGPDASSSAASAQTESLSDSWESFSNSPSKEEYIEGALAISTSSFDCYLENFEKEDWHFNEIDKKSTKLKGSSKTRPIYNAPQKPYLSSSKHTTFERKKSDGQIIDFTDREPMNRPISSEESHHHLKPLKLKSKTKTRKPESEPGCSCHIQSISCNTGRISRCNSPVSYYHKDHHVSKSLSENKKPNAFQVEVATQVEIKDNDNVVQQLSDNLLENNLHLPKCDTNCENANMSRQKTPKESSHDLNVSLPKDEAAHEGNLTNLSDIAPADDDPSETEIQPTETEENSDPESPNLGIPSDVFHERPTTPDP